MGNGGREQEHSRRAMTADPFHDGREGRRDRRAPAGAERSAFVPPILHRRADTHMKDASCKLMGDATKSPRPIRAFAAAEPVSSTTDLPGKSTRTRLLLVFFVLVLLPFGLGFIPLGIPFVEFGILLFVPASNASVRS